MTTPKICLVGDVVVDVSLKTEATSIKLRLGGIIHAARCLWAMSIPYSVGFFAPSYLDSQIENYLKAHGCVKSFKLGNIIGCPNVFLIDEVKEIASQGYEFLLREELKVEVIKDSVEYLSNLTAPDYLFISGNYDLGELINAVQGNIHLDIANNLKSLDILHSFRHKLSSIFLSTSSDLFINFFKDDFKDFAMLFSAFSEKIILKENRGGSRCYEFAEDKIYFASSQTQLIQHSIGVGDVYDACFIASQPNHTISQALNLSSWIAAEYAITTYPDDFKTGVTRVLTSNINDLEAMGGVILTWESRKLIHIYIAAPDFDYINSKHIEKVVESLQYHNFSPRRPVKENGQLRSDSSSKERRNAYLSDLALLDECSLVVAVNLIDDPGTFIEIGLAAAKGIPIIVYDPYRRATNCMLTETPALVSNDLDDIISQIFIICANFQKNG